MKWQPSPAILVFSILALVGCSSERIEELVWLSSDKSIDIKVESKKSLGRTRSTVIVIRSGVTKEISLDDDVPLSNVTLLQSGSWILILSNQFVLGGFNKTDDQVVGEGEWDKLPFTVWAGSGEILAEGPYRRSLRTILPVNYPLIPDPAIISSQGQSAP